MSRLIMEQQSKPYVRRKVLRHAGIGILSVSLAGCTTPGGDEENGEDEEGGGGYDVGGGDAEARGG